MRTSLLALATLLLVSAATRTTFGQAPAWAKAQGYQPSQLAPAIAWSQPRDVAPQSSGALPGQAGWPVQQVGGEEGVQPAGHGHAMQPAANCPPGGYGGNAGGPRSLGTGTFPYGSQYDHLHPGRPFDGGRYGYFGGAHRTPGYPHHHFNRSYIGPQGPPSAQVGYPYYTTRGPRDFLMDNPPSIGR